MQYFSREELIALITGLKGELTSYREFVEFLFLFVVNLFNRWQPKQKVMKDLSKLYKLANSVPSVPERELSKENVPPLKKAKLRTDFDSTRLD